MPQRKAAKDDIQFAEFLSDLVARFDPQFRHTYVNSAVEHFTGRKAQEFVGKTNLELGMPDELVSQWNEALGHVFRTGVSSDITFDFPVPGGTRYFHSCLIPELTPSGGVASVVSIARDVTGAFSADAKSSSNHVQPEFCRAILESTGDAIVGITLEGIVTRWNAAAQTMFGYTAEEMLGQSITCLLPANVGDEERFIVERLQHGEKLEHLETVRLHKSGRHVHVSVTTSPIFNARGEIIGASKIARDITPLKIERERLELALDATSSGLWDWDITTGIVYRSDHCLEILGFSQEDDTHDFAFFLRAVHPQDLPNVLQIIENFRETKSDRIEFDCRVVSKNGLEDTWVRATGKAVGRDSEGRPTRIVGTLIDITNSRIVYASLLDREKRLTRVIDGSDQGYWDLNIQTNSLDVSPRWASMLGYTRDEIDILDGRFEQYVHPEDFVSVMGKLQLHLQGELPFLEAEIRCLTKTGDWAWILTRGRVVERDAKGNPLMVSGTHTDISERKKHEMSQRDAATVFENSYEGIMVVNRQGLIASANPAFTRITGYSPQEVIGRSPRMLSSGRHDPNFYKSIYRSLAEKHFWTGEIWNRRKNGQIYAELLSISTVLNNEGAVQHYIGIFTDISQLKEHQAELDRVAHYDPLTGTPNRRLLADRLQQAIASADRHQKTMAVCYLDLDGFKEINDHHGHNAGDDLLIGITRSLKAVLRTEDTLARLGGDEFVLLLYDIGTLQECTLILERILQAIKSPVVTDVAVISVTASVGVAFYPQDHSDADTLMRHADQAMYRAKEAGKDGFHLFDPESDQKAQLHRKMVERLHSAMQNEEFRLFYQPKVDLSDGSVMGFEALLRWQHPDEGLLSPMAFLPYVEGTTVDHPLSKWVIASALRQAAQWMQLGQTLKVSVNISAHSLLHPDFLDELRAALAFHPDLPADFLELEVLESVTISDMDNTIRVLDACHSIGVKLALDDFGTGYSSLTYLRKLPVDILKIDQSFVRDMLTDLEDRGIVDAVIRMATAFNRQVIAEGVETLEHGAMLLKMGCHLAQGYGIAKPMPDHEVLTWSRRWAANREWEKISVNV